MQVHATQSLYCSLPSPLSSSAGRRDPLEALNVASGDTPVTHGEQRTINRRRKSPQPVRETAPVCL
jgi:hypothetical protein